MRNIGFYPSAHDAYKTEKTNKMLASRIQHIHKFMETQKKNLLSY